MSSSNNTGSNLVFFLLGAACGAAIALLYAPVEGEEARRVIGEKANDVKGKATDFTSSVTQSAKDQYSSLANKAQDLINRGQQAANDTVNQAADGARDAINSSTPS